MARFYDMASSLGVVAVVALWYGILPAAATCEERNVRFQGVELSLLRDLKDVSSCRAACVKTLACQHFSFTEKQVVSMTDEAEKKIAQQKEAAEAAEAAAAQAEEAKEEKAKEEEKAEKAEKAAEEEAEEVKETRQKEFLAAKAERQKEEQKAKDALQAEVAKMFGQQSKERRLVHEAVLFPSELETAQETISRGLETVAPSLCLLFDSNSHKESVDAAATTGSDGPRNAKVGTD